MKSYFNLLCRFILTYQDAGRVRHVDGLTLIGTDILRVPHYHLLMVKVRGCSNRSLPGDPRLLFS